MGDLLALEGIVKDFIDTLPQDFKDCVTNDADTAELLTAFPATVDEKKVISWVTLKISKVNKEIKNISALWTAGSYEDCGKAASVLAHDALANQEDFLG